MRNIIGFFSCLNCGEPVHYEASFTDSGFETDKQKTYARIFGFEHHQGEKYLKFAFNARCQSCHLTNVFCFLSRHDRIGNEVFQIQAETTDLSFIFNGE